MKTYLLYGFALALGSLLLNALLFFLGFHSDPASFGKAQIIGTVGGLAISIACIILGLKARRAEIPASEPFGYGRALGAGVMIVLFGSLFGIVAHLLYTTVINPDFSELTVQAQIAKMEESGLPGEQIDAAEGMMRKFMHPAIQAAFAFIGGLVFGTVLSLVIAAFMRRPASAIEPPLTA